MTDRSEQDDSGIWLDEEGDEQFERIARRQRAAMPVSSGRLADRSSKKTPGSRRAKKEVSQQSGGIHRRRQKRVR